MEKQQRNYNEILKTVMVANNMSRRDVEYICHKTESTVSKWLNGSLSPGDLEVFLLMLAVRAARGIIPRSLTRAHTSAQRRAFAWAKRNRTEREWCETVGKKINLSEKGKFIYENQLCTRAEIVDKSGLHSSTVYKRTKVIANGADVTEIINKKDGKLKVTIMNMAQLSNLTDEDMYVWCVTFNKVAHL